MSSSFFIIEKQDTEQRKKSCKQEDLMIVVNYVKYPKRKGNKCVVGMDAWWRIWMR